MRNLSLEQFYKRIAKQITIVGAYTENPYMPIIIRGCRLKPITVFSPYFTTAPILERVWIDEFGNAIEIKKRKPKIKLDISKSQITTDIYKYENLNFLIKRSVLACIGLYDHSDSFILSILGTDNYWRAYQYIDGQFNTCSPLLVGLKVIQSALRWNKKSFKTFKFQSDIKTLSNVKWFMTKLPIDIETEQHILKYNKLRSILSHE